jgi:hypothetical protein
MERIMPRPSSPRGRRIFLGTQLRHRLTEHLVRVERQLVLFADVFQFVLQCVFNPSFGFVTP